MAREAPARIAFQTLGCKLNQYETDSLAARFEAEGYELVPFGAPAEVYVINTCTVTNKADRKSRNTINRALRSLPASAKGERPGSLPSAIQLRDALFQGAFRLPDRAAFEPVKEKVDRSDAGFPMRLQGHGGGTAHERGAAAGSGAGLEGGSLTPPSESPPEFLDLPAPEEGGFVVVTGCFAPQAKHELEADGRTIVVENERKAFIFDLVEARLRGEMLGPDDLPANNFAFSPQNQLFHTRGMLKIQDGCDNFCTFCIIPFVRGTAQSRALPDILKEARDLLARGYKELVLTGVNMSRYRWEGQGFSEVLEAILKLDQESDFRLRISSIEPDQIDGRFFELMKHPRMTRHLHLCLQSGSERILLAMRRQYTYAQFREIAARLRAFDPLFNITTDIIVGFPGEGEEEFAASLRADAEIGFGHIHIFPYSRRSGTRADRLASQVPEATKSARVFALSEASGEVKRIYRRGLVGSVQRVLVERVTPDPEGRLMARGLGEYYVPIRFEVPSGESELRNHYFQVKVIGIDGGDEPDLIGKSEEQVLPGT